MDLFQQIAVFQKFLTLEVILQRKLNIGLLVCELTQVELSPKFDKKDDIPKCLLSAVPIFLLQHHHSQALLWCWIVCSWRKAEEGVWRVKPLTKKNYANLILCQQNALQLVLTPKEQIYVAGWSRDEHWHRWRPYFSVHFLNVTTRLQHPFPQDRGMGIGGKPD